MARIRERPSGGFQEIIRRCAEGRDLGGPASPMLVYSLHLFEIRQTACKFRSGALRLMTRMVVWRTWPGL